jgi:hypothetical protein
MGHSCYAVHSITKFVLFSKTDEIYINSFYIYLKNSVALVRKRTIPTERPPLVGGVSANFCG